MWRTFGHDRVKNILDRQIAAGSVNHAYLFVGPEQIGKKTLARECAARLLATEALEAHPDFVFLDGRTSGGVAAVRQFIERLSVKPFVGSYVIGVLDNADALTPEAANALLKTLEEPHPSVVLFLIAGSNSMLPTIVSRCQIFVCHRLSSSQLAEYTKDRSLSVTHDMLALSGGCIGVLSNFIDDPDQHAQLAVTIQNLDAAANGSDFQKLDLISKMADHETDALKTVLLSWCRFRAGDIAYAHTLANILEALQQLDSYVQKKHVLAKAVGLHV